MINLLNSTKLYNLTVALLLITFGYFFAKRASKFLKHLIHAHFSRHHVLLVSRAAFYSIFILFCFLSLEHLGFNLNVLLGAAGVFTVAISFASQTAASNLISGIFLLFEHPFKVGDTIDVKGINGVVDSIDLLSTKLITADNKLVRIPNETMIKSEITNLNYFKTRRIDIFINIVYNTNIDFVKSILLNIAEQCKNILKEPHANVIINQFIDSSVELKFMVWVKTGDVNTVKNHLQEMIKLQFEENNIAIPIPFVLKQTLQPTIQPIKNNELKTK